MNNARRKEIAKAKGLIDQAKSLIEEAQGIIDTCAGEEREYYDNMPEGLQGSERGETADQNADTLESQANELGDLDSALQEAADKADEIVGELDNIE